MKMIEKNVHGYKAFREYADTEETTPLLENLYFSEKLTDCFKWYACEEAVPLENVQVVEMVVEEAEVMTNNRGDLGNLYIGQNPYYMHVLNRRELLENVLSLSPLEILDFVKKVRLTEEEIALFLNIDSAIDRAIQYYQRGDKLVYKRRFENKSV